MPHDVLSTTQWILAVTQYYSVGDYLMMHKSHSAWILTWNQLGSMGIVYHYVFIQTTTSYCGNIKVYGQ